MSTAATSTGLASRRVLSTDFIGAHTSRGNDTLGREDAQSGLVPKRLYHSPRRRPGGRGSAHSRHTLTAGSKAHDMAISGVTFDVPR